MNKYTNQRIQMRNDVRGKRFLSVEGFLQQIIA